MANNNIKTAILILVILFSMHSILALGVSSPYWKDNPLSMYPGQIKEVAFTLTNKPDAETAVAFVSMDDDAGIAEITSGTEYNVAPGSTNSKIMLKISVPDTATIGDTYNVKFSVTSEPPKGQGPVQLTMGYNVEFPVKVVEQSQASNEQFNESQSKEVSWVIWGIIILVILIVVSFLIKKKR